jgi:hypothetical protein
MHTKLGKKLLTELRMHEPEYALLDKPIVIYADNTGAIALAKNYVAKACAMYSDSVDDNATQACFFEDHEIGPLAR